MLEFEQLVKVFFAEHGTKEDLLATIASVRRWSDQRFIDSIGTSRRATSTGEGPFPERLRG